MQPSSRARVSARASSTSPAASSRTASPKSTTTPPRRVPCGPAQASDSALLTPSRIPA
ncbi:hypothetical protein LUX33_09025 [Actinomadura madurae]|nr:hypothetical protein [Actinomadura madurae]MCP9948542.1 hypothetical protein [Actinomadura madurae]